MRGDCKTGLVSQERRLAMLTTCPRPQHQTSPRLAETCQLGVMRPLRKYPLHQMVPVTAKTPMVLQTALSAPLARSLQAFSS